MRAGRQESVHYFSLKFTPPINQEGGGGGGGGALFTPLILTFPSLTLQLVQFNLLY